MLACVRKEFGPTVSSISDKFSWIHFYSSTQQILTECVLRAFTGYTKINKVLLAHAFEVGNTESERIIDTCQGCYKSWMRYMLSNLNTQLSNASFITSIFKMKELGFVWLGFDVWLQNQCLKPLHSPSKWLMPMARLNSWRTYY